MRDRGSARGGTVRITTSRYHSADLITESGLLPIGTTIGAARFLRYELAANVGMLAPFGCRHLDEDPVAFTAAYRERLDGFGVEKIARVLEAIAAGYDSAGVVLLCFEKVHEGEFCHRRVFAEWWEEKTGQVVPELPI